MSDIEKLCLVLKALVGDLSLTGALPEFKRNMLWVQIDEIRESAESGRIRDAEGNGGGFLDIIDN